MARQNPLSLLPGLERRRRAARTNLDSAKRAQQESDEREKYTLLLADVIRQAKLPVVAQLDAVNDDGRSWKRIFGTRRSKTLRNRFRSWRAFSRWLETSYHKVWPSSIVPLLEYADEKYNDDCGKTVLPSFQAALSVLEQAGRVPEAEMLSRDPTWLAQLASYTADLEAAQPERKQAPLFTVAIVVALELYVCLESEPEYARALGWVVLLMVYASLRADDVQAIRPETMEITGSGFKAKLGRTKTTGPDRRCKEVYIFVKRDVGLSGQDWLVTGFELWEKYKQPRDFLVLEANGDWTAPTNKGVDSSGVALYMKSVLSRLGTPKRISGSYRLNEHRSLLPDGAYRMYTGHSPRNFLASVAAAIGVRKEDIDYLGRWLISRLSGAGDYIRTSREVVHRVQETVCRALLEGVGGQYHEDEALSMLKSYVDGLGTSGSLARRQHDILRRGDGQRHLGLKWPAFSPALEDPDSSAEDLEEAPVFSASKYFITTSSKTGLRRLHLNGPCHVKHYHCSSVVFVDQVNLEDIDSVCRDCKHRLRREAGQEAVEDSSSQSSESSS